MLKSSKIRIALAFTSEKSSESTNQEFVKDLVLKSIFSEMLYETCISFPSSFSDMLLSLLSNVLQTQFKLGKLISSLQKKYGRIFVLRFLMVFNITNL